MTTKEERAELLKEADFEKKQLVIATLLTLAGTSFVLARLWVRGRFLKQWFIDDWFILLAMILGITSYVSWGFANIPELLVHQRNGSSEPTSGADAANRAIAQVQADSYNLVGLAWNCAFIALQATAGRLSVFYTFRRLSSSKRTRNIRRVIHVIAGIMVVATLALAWLSLSPCWPPRDIKVEDGQGCWVIGDYLSPGYRPLKLWLFLFSSIMNAIMDLFAFTLPFLIFRGASLTSTQKKGLYYLFGFGLVLISTTPLLLGLTEANGVMVGGALPVLVKPLFGSLWSRASAIVHPRPKDSVTAVLRNVKELRDVSDEARAASLHNRSESKFTISDCPWDMHMHMPNSGTARSSRTYVDSTADDYPSFVEETELPSAMLKDHVFPMGTHDFRRDCESAFQIVHSDAEEDFYHAK